MLDAALARAEQEGLSHLNFLQLILGEPAVRSRQRAVERRIREARFREEKSLAQFDWKFNAPAIDRAQIEQLATGEFVRRGENLVMMGQSGVGKSFLLQALSRRFCELGYRVRYTTSVSDYRVRGTTSVQARTRTGRIRLSWTPAPFMTKLVNPAAHAGIQLPIEHRMRGSMRSVTCRGYADCVD